MKSHVTFLTKQSKTKSNPSNEQMIPKNHKNLESETMRTVTLTPNSSVRSSTTTDSNNISETRDSYYFPGCRKDANCKCSICIESINATLDLIPNSHRRSSVTKFSSSISKPILQNSPVSFNTSSAATTTKKSVRFRPVTFSPHLNPNVGLDFQEKVNGRKKECRIGVLSKIFLGLILVLGLEYGFSSLVSGVLKARLSPSVVNNLVNKSWDFEDLNGKFVFLKKKMESVIGRKISSCSSVDSIWKIFKDGFLLHYRCILYESMAEEISIWGWPHQTAGLLMAEYYSRSFSIISGRVAEWSSGEAKYLVREANSSWTQGKWSSYAVQFDPNTWIIEYRPSFVSDNRRIISAVVELLKFKIMSKFEKMKKEFWHLSALADRNFLLEERQTPMPT